MAKRFLTPTGLVSLASDPATGSEGNLYFNNTSDVIKIYRNGAWENLVHTSEEIQDAASGLLDHSNHVNIEATYDDNNNQIILEADLSSVGATGYYGSFYHSSSAIISASATTQEVVIPINTTAEANGVSIQNNISGKPTRIKFANAGVYNIQFSVQLANSNNTIHNATIWLKKNGTNVPSSSGQVTVPEKHGGVNGQIIQAWNYVMSLAANDFIEFYFQVEDIGIFIETIPVGTTPTTPESPAIIVTAQQITNTLAPGFGGSGSSFYLNDLLDVSIISPENHQLVAFNQETGLWKNLHPSEINLATLTNLNSASTSLLASASTLYIPKTDQQSIINTASAAAVNYVVDSAPGALDTLNELAAALNDDANFASTVIGTIASSSAAAVSSAVSSASANTVSQINALTTSDIEEGSRLYFTNQRSLTTASTALVHSNHTNITATYNSASNQIILTGNAGGGGAGGDGASVIYSTEQPDTSQLSIGDIWVDSNASVGYSGSSTPFVNQLTYWLEDDNGNLLPDADNVYSVGSSAFRVKDLYLGASSLYMQNPSSPNQNIALTMDLNGNMQIGNHKIITTGNAQSNLDLSSYATKLYANSASAYALNSASAYTQSQLDSASSNLTSSINTKLSIQSASTTYATKAELSNVNVDLSAYLSKAEASAMYQKRIPYSSASPTPTQLGDMWVDNTGTAAILNIWDGNEWKYESYVPTPNVLSILPVSSTSAGTIIDITGANFVSGATVQFIGTNGTPYNATVVQRVSATLLKATTPALAQAYEPYSIKVINPSGNYGILAGALDAGSTPAWITPQGSIGTLYDIERGIKTFNVSASDADLQSLQYSIVGGALPAGMILSASAGVISGLASPVVNDTTYTFDVRASDGINSSTRTFSLLMKAPVTITYTSVGSNTFTAPTALTYVKILLVGGGGGAGSSRGNGPGGNGGGGGIVYNPLVAVTAGQTYSLNVGGAGSGSGCNNQSGCSGGVTTGFGGTAGGGGGGVSEHNGNCNSGWAGTSSMVGATALYEGGSGGCSFGAGGGGTQYSNSEFGSPTTFGGQCASQYYGGGGCHSGGGGAQGIIRVKY
jgi:hypothetical protein